jgi:cyclophilin family peptidyl-prolyl cis-trans isomerase/HEAT repeat protein
LTSLLLAALLSAANPPAARADSRIGKMARILALEDQRTTGGGELERYLVDPDRGVRRRAALAAGRIGDPSVVPALIDLMNEGEAEVRQMSAFAMGLIGDRLATERLTASLRDSAATVRARAAEALGRIGDPRAATAVAQMVLEATPKGAPLVTVRGDDPGSATDPWLELRLGLFALAQLKDVKAAESVLLPGGKPRFDWWAATWTASRLESPALRPVLVAAASSDDPLSRALAARGLGALKDPANVEPLASLSRDANESVAVAALRALAATGDAAGVAPAAAALASTDVTLKWEALEALVALPPDRSLRGRVVPYIGHESPWVREAALRALARIDRDDFALVLSGLDPDPEWSVRAALATALGDSGTEVSVGILFSMLKDDDARVLPVVLDAMRKARGPDAADTLRGYLDHPDVAVRAAAAEGLTALKATGLTAALAASYQRSLADGETRARAALVDALVAQKDEASRAAARSAAKSDPSRAVRARAAAALRAMGEAPPAVVPDAVDRPLLDYREAMAPYDPTPGMPLYTPRVFIHTRQGRIEIHLDIVYAPLTCESFSNLVRRGFYDGLTFHRVVPGLVVQGGCPRGDGNGGPGYARRSEVGPRPFGRGAVGMALSDKDAEGSQFFVTLAPGPNLDGAYTLVGAVAAGMDVVDRIRPGDVIEKIEIWDGR